MTSENADSPWRKKIGEYLGLEPIRLERVLIEQDRLRSQGHQVRMGALLQADGITVEELNNALSLQRRDRLISCSLFAGVTGEEMNRITTLVSEESVEPGAEIIRQDSKGDSFYLLASGRAEVCRMGEYGEMFPVTAIEPGESIGEIGYFANGRRTASVYATERCDLLKIRYADLDDLFRAAPTLTNNFLTLITDRLRRTNIRFQEVAEQGLLAERSLESLSRFLDMSDTTALSSGIDGLIERIVLTASKVMEAERASLFLLDVTAGELWSKVAEGLQQKEIRVPISRGVAGWVVQHDRVVNIPDAYADDRFDQTVDSETGFRTRNILCGPIKNLQGEIVGAIEVINKRDGIYGPREESLFKAFIYQTAVALENFHLYSRLLAHHRRLTILMDVAVSLSQTLDLDALINKIVTKTCEILDAERCTLFLWDRDADELWSRVILGDGLKEIRIPSGAGLAGYVAHTGETLNIDDVYQDTRFNPSVDRQSGYLTRDILCMPVVNREGQIIGVTEMINKKKGRFGADDIEMLAALTSQIAVALENAQLYRNTVTMKNYLTSVQNSISNAILTLDDDCRVITANGVAVTLFALDREKIGKVDFFSLLSPESNRLIDLLQKVRINRQALVDYDLEMVLARGDRHTVNINFVPLIDPQEGRQGLVLIFENITLEKRLKGTLSRYMSKDIVDRILDDPCRQTLGGIKTKATIMFTDIRRFTAIAESLSAEQTVEFLNQYFSAMVDLIFHNEGVLDKYIGDNIMAVFGVPYPREDDAVRAVRTAMQMRSSLEGVNRERMAKGLEPIRIGIGICTGNVVSGNIGTERRMEYTVIGDEVNIASRLENLCGYYGVDILIGEATRQEIGDQFMTRPVDFVLVRGKKNPVYIYEVLCEGTRPLTAAEECFYRGLQYYRQGDFEQAAREFAADHSGDRLFQIYLNRCRTFLETPPPQDWNGAWIFDSR